MKKHQRLEKMRQQQLANGNNATIPFDGKTKSDSDNNNDSSAMPQSVGIEDDKGRKCGCIGAVILLNRCLNIHFVCISNNNDDENTKGRNS